MQYQLTQCAQNKNENSPQIRYTSASEGPAACGAHRCQKQSGADGTTDGDHLDLPLSHPLLVTRLMGIQRTPLPVCLRLCALTL